MERREIQVVGVVAALLACIVIAVGVFTCAKFIEIVTAVATVALAAIGWLQYRIYSAQLATMEAANPPCLQVTTPQIWIGGDQPDSRQEDVEEIVPGQKYRARVHVINAGGNDAFVDADPEKQGNVCVAWFSQSDDAPLPMFRPYKNESAPGRGVPEKHRLRKLKQGGCHSKREDWIESDEDGLGKFLRISAGELARWDFDFVAPLSEQGGVTKCTLYLMGIVVYWDRFRGNARRRRAIGFACKFDPVSQIFVRIKNEDYPDYSFVE